MATSAPARVFDLVQLSFFDHEQRISLERRAPHRAAASLAAAVADNQAVLHG